MTKILIIGLIFAMGMMFTPSTKASTLTCTPSQTIENNIQTIVNCETETDPESPFYGDKKSTSKFDLTKTTSHGHLLMSNYVELFRNGATTPWQTENNIYAYDENNQLVTEQRHTFTYDENLELFHKRIDVKNYDGTPEENIIKAYTRDEDLRELGWFVGTTEYAYEGQTLLTSKSDCTNGLGRVESTNYVTYDPNTARPSKIVSHIYHPEGWLQIEETRTNLTFDKYNNIVSADVNTVNFVTEGPQNDDQQSQEEAANLIKDPATINDGVLAQSFATNEVKPTKFTIGTPKLNKGTHYKTVANIDVNKNNVITSNVKYDGYNKKLAKATTIKALNNKTISKEQLYYANDKISSKALETYAKNGKIATTEITKYQSDGKTLKSSAKTIFNNGKKTQTIAKTFNANGKLKTSKATKY